MESRCCSTRFVQRMNSLLCRYRTSCPRWLPEEGQALAVPAFLFCPPCGCELGHRWEELLPCRGSFPLPRWPPAWWRGRRGDDEREGGRVNWSSSRQGTDGGGLSMEQKGVRQKTAHIPLFLNTGSRCAEGKLNYVAIFKVIH